LTGFASLQKQANTFASQHSSSCGKWQAAHALMGTLLVGHTHAWTDCL